MGSEESLDESFYIHSLVWFGVDPSMLGHTRQENETEEASKDWLNAVAWNHLKPVLFISALGKPSHFYTFTVQLFPHVFIHSCACGAIFQFARQKRRMNLWQSWRQGRLAECILMIFDALMTMVCFFIVGPCAFAPGLSLIPPIVHTFCCVWPRSARSIATIQKQWRLRLHAVLDRSTIVIHT